MCVIDHRCKFRYFTASHDTKIFEQSFLCAKLLDRFDSKQPLALLGDEGYGCSDVMMTPARHQQLLRASSDMKAKMKSYNKAIRKPTFKWNMHRAC